MSHKHRPLQGPKKNPAGARALASVTGEIAGPGRTKGSLPAELLEIGRCCAALPGLDRRTANEILGYGEHVESRNRRVPLRFCGSNFALTDVDCVPTK